MFRKLLATSTTGPSPSCAWCGCNLLRARRTKSAGLVRRLRLLRHMGFFTGMLHIPSPSPFWRSAPSSWAHRIGGGRTGTRGRLRHRLQMIVAVLMVPRQFRNVHELERQQKGEGFEYHLWRL